MRRLISVCLAVVMLLAVGAFAVSAEEPVFVFDVKGVNATIGGEDAVICTTQDAYDNCNPKWAITVLCEVVSANVLQVKETPTAGQGAVPSLKVGDGVVALVVHSSTSNEEQADQYPNVFAKNAAMAATAGQYLVLEGLDLAAGTGSGTATLFNELPSDISVDDPVESSEEPAESTEEPVESSEESIEEPAESSEEPAAPSEEEPVSEAASEPAAESTEESKDEDGGLSTTTIVLIAVAALVVIGLAVFFIAKGKKTK